MGKVSYVQHVADALVAQATAMLADYGTWYPELVELSKVGYPAGGGGGRSSGVSDPTFNAANGRDVMRDERKEHDRDMKALVAVLDKIARRRAWLMIRDAKNYDVAPVICETCGNRISGERSDVQREGECPRCYIHRKRHSLPWPKRYASREEAASMGL